MKPLKVALIVKASPSTFERSLRNMGYWSYPVDEFEWEHFSWAENFNMPRKEFKRRGFDLIFHEDACFGVYPGDEIPAIYYDIDSTLSDEHYKVRLRQSKQADLVLVDHDDPDRFGAKAIQFPYCVNDQVFKSDEKLLDISFHCGSGESRGMQGGKERNQIRSRLHDIAKDKGYSYRSGGLGLLEYARSMGQSKVIVNWPRTKTNRPHRVFDAMASGACLLTGPIPKIPEDQINGCYVEFEEFNDLGSKLDFLLGLGWFTSLANAGHKVVMENHTWAVRAKQLRELINKEFNI